MAFWRFPEAMHLGVGPRAGVQKRRDVASFFAWHITQLAIIVSKNEDRVGVVDIVRLSLQRNVVTGDEPLTRSTTLFEAEGATNWKIHFKEHACARSRGVPRRSPLGPCCELSLT
jgi:hypothetical protein